VQGLSAESERLGQFALIDPLLHQLNRQQLPLGLFAQIDLFEQRTTIVDLAFASRSAREMKLIGSADGKA
jgi:Na+-transporting methylmalonyl-CoA/oxaloacetate decarboxylase beta subunit